MSNKTKNLLKLAPSVFIAFVITMSAAYKLSNPPSLVQHLTEMGLIQYLKMCAVMELLFIGLFLHPRTMKIGFMLLTGYFGGAIAVELAYGSAVIPPAVILSVVWIAAYLRKPGIFYEKRLSAISYQPSAIS